MSTNGYAVEIVKDPKVLQSLQPDWDRLFQRADRPYLSQSFEWAWCVWKTITKPSGGSPHCILRYHRLWRAARPLSMGGDYTDVLVEASPQERPLTEWGHEAISFRRTGRRNSGYQLWNTSGRRPSSTAVTLHRCDIDAALIQAEVGLIEVY